MRSIEQMIQSEVLCCMSGVVANVASLYGAAFRDADRAMGEFAEQAFELSAPVLDYESAAIEAGWTWRDGLFWVNGESTHSGCGEHNGAPDWSGVCAEHDIEPHEREVFEHWAVSSWFAAKLEAAGERVDTDFAGLCVWARTTTGQAIYADHVVEQIYAATHYGKPDAFEAWFIAEGVYQPVYNPSNLACEIVTLAAAGSEASAREIVDRWRKLATGPVADAIRAAHP